MEKIRKKVKEHAPCILAVLLTILLYFVVYAIFSMFPFGKGTFSRYDGIHQVDAFLKHLSNVFYGKDSFAFSFRYGAGQDMVGSLIYICFSPFALIYMLFGWGNIHYVTNFVIILKSVAMVIAFYYMLRKVYPKLTSKKLQFLLLISYLTCGYFCANQSWYSWIDYLIYLPILVVAFRHMMVKKKILPFTIMLCLMFAASITLSIQCYIIGVILLCLYPIMALEKEERNVALKNIILSSLLAVIILSPSIVTMFKVVKDTTRLSSGGVFGQSVYIEGYFSKYAFLILDTIVLGIAICGMFRKNKDSKEKYYTGVLVISLLPIVIDQIAILISFGTYYGYFYRFGFLYQIVLFCYVSYLLEKKCEEGVTFAHKTEKAHKWLYLFLGIGMIVSIVGVMLTFQDPYFSSAQASGIVFACLLLIFWPILLFVIFLWRGINAKKITKRMLTIFTLSFYSIQLILFGGSIIGMGNYNLTTYATYQHILDQYDLHGKRIKIVGEYDQLMMGMSLDYIDNESFTSSLHANNLVHSKALSYDNNKVNCMENDGGTILSDCIMGYDYFITDIKSSLPFLELLGQEKDYYIYHNTLSLSNGFGVDSKDLIINDDMYITTKQNALYHFLGGEENVASNTTLYDYLPSNIFETNEQSSYRFIVPKDNRKIENITIPVKAGYQYYIVGNFQDVFKSYTLKGKTYDMRSAHMIDLGYYELDEIISLDLTVEEYTRYPVYNDYYLEILSLDIDKLTSTLQDVVRTSGSIITNKNKLTYQFDDSHAYHVLPYTYLEGFGSELIKNDLGLIMTANSVGTLTYHSPYWSLLMKLIIVAIVLACMIAVAIKFGWFRWLEKCSFVLAMVYSAVVLCVLCFAGIGLEVMSWIKLIF